MAALASDWLTVGTFSTSPLQPLHGLRLFGTFLDSQMSNKQNRSTEGCSKLKRSVDMTSSGKNGLNIRTNASPKWDRTRCPEE